MRMWEEGEGEESTSVWGRGGRVQACREEVGRGGRRGGGGEREKTKRRWGEGGDEEGGGDEEEAGRQVR